MARSSLLDAYTNSNKRPTDWEVKDKRFEFVKHMRTLDERAWQSEHNMENFLSLLSTGGVVTAFTLARDFRGRLDGSYLFYALVFFGISLLVVATIKIIRIHRGYYQKGEHVKAVLRYLDNRQSLESVFHRNRFTRRHDQVSLYLAYISLALLVFGMISIFMQAGSQLVGWQADVLFRSGF